MRKIHLRKLMRSQTFRNNEENVALKTGYVVYIELPKMGTTLTKAVLML